MVEPRVAGKAGRPYRGQFGKRDLSDAGLAGTGRKPADHKNVTNFRETPGPFPNASGVVNSLRSKTIQQRDFVGIDKDISMLI